MTDTPIPRNKRSLWTRAIFMLLMALAFQVCGTVLCVVIVMQFIIVLLSDTPNARLVGLGRSLGNYLRQIIGFLTFATEDIPFPFSAWPASDE